MKFKEYLNEAEKISKLEKNVVRQLHLQGYWGKSGSFSKKKRLEVLQGLINKGYLDKDGKPTKKGIEASK